MWTDVLLYFLLGLSLCSLLGAASYFLGQWFRRLSPKWSKRLDAVLALLGLVALNFYLVLLGPLCYAGALSQYHSQGRTRSVFSHFVQLLSATALPTLVVFFVWLELSLMFPGPYNAIVATASASLLASTAAEHIALWCGAMLGLMVTPSAIPIAVWVWHSSKLRPGLDRPLLQGDLLD